MQPVYQSWGWVSKRIAPKNRHKLFMTSIKNPRRSTAGRVEHIRLELTTSCMPCKRSTRWANAPLKNGHKSIPAAKVRRIFGVCKFICNILIKIQVPLFPRGMHSLLRSRSFGAKIKMVRRIFWDNKILRNNGQWPISQNYQNYSLYSKKTELARCYLKEQRPWLGMVNLPYAS